MTAPKLEVVKILERVEKKVGRYEKTGHHIDLREHIEITMGVNMAIWGVEQAGNAATEGNMQQASAFMDGAIQSAQAAETTIDRLLGT